VTQSGQVQVPSVVNVCVVINIYTVKAVDTVNQLGNPLVESIFKYNQESAGSDVDANDPVGGLFTSVVVAV
jgi:hypothetical protein